MPVGAGRRGAARGRVLYPSTRRSAAGRGGIVFDAAGGRLCAGIAIGTRNFGPRRGFVSAATERNRRRLSSLVGPCTQDKTRWRALHRLVPSARHHKQYQTGRSASLGKEWASVLLVFVSPSLKLTTPTYQINFYQPALRRHSPTAIVSHFEPCLWSVQKWLHHWLP